MRRTSLLLLLAMNACAAPQPAPEPLYSEAWCRRIATRIVADGFSLGHLETGIGYLMQNGAPPEVIEADIPSLEAAYRDGQSARPASGDPVFLMPPTSVALEAAFPWCAFGVTGTACW